MNSPRKKNRISSRRSFGFPGKTSASSQKPANNLMSIEGFIKYILSKSDFREVVCHKVIPSREASFGKIPLAPEVKTRLASLGTERLYTHQCLAIELARLGKNVVVMTPTASGKSL
ncbi:MAG: hypothetical protein AAB065_04950, partial [Deltaproteobacteria bacterium]